MKSLATEKRVHVYLRRSRNEAGKQEFSLDVQRARALEFLPRLGLGAEQVVEHVDDGKSGDDFHSRAGLRRLLADVRPGDVVVCRDQSRLGRDALEVTLVVRELVRDRRCSLYYYVTGATQPVPFENALDQAMTFVQGTGHQIELEGLRGRVREALQERARAGRIAGGACYGYQQERTRDASGRRFTVATVDEAQAAVVRRIFAEYRANKGLKAIARGLNRDGVPPPQAGRRGTGSWSPTCIRAMLLNPRYRGIYVYGRVKKDRRSGVLARVKAPAKEVTAIEMPEWRIIDDETWLAVQERFSNQAPQRRMTKPRAKYPLTGIARCGQCGGAIIGARQKRGHESVKVYGCGIHHTRGKEACPATVRRPMEEVEAALIDHLQERVLTPAVMDTVLADIRREVEAQTPRREADLAALEDELRTARAAQRKLAKAAALADDIPELVDELRQRSARMLHLEAQIAAAKRTPAEAATVMAGVEETAAAKLRDLRSSLADRSDLRAVFLDLFPEGLTFTPTEGNGRRGWKIAGVAAIAEQPEAAGLGLFNLRGDPRGT